MPASVTNAGCRVAIEIIGKPFDAVTLVYMGLVFEHGARDRRTPDLSVAAW